MPKKAIVRVNLECGIALLIPKICLQNLLRNSRFLSLELKIMMMPSTAGKVQISILMIRIAKPIFKSGIEIYKKSVHERYSCNCQLKLKLTVEHRTHKLILKVLQLLSIYFFILLFDLLKSILFSYRDD